MASAVDSHPSGGHDASHCLLLAFCSVCLLVSGIALSTQAADAAAPPAYKNPQLPVERRVEDLLGRMTPAEKARMLAGSGWMESFPDERLGIPAIKMADGPMGVRNWTGSSAVTNAGHDLARPRHGVSGEHRHGVELGRRPRPGAGPRRSRRR